MKNTSTSELVNDSIKDLTEQLQVAEARTAEDAAEIKELSCRLEIEVARAISAEKNVQLAKNEFFGGRPEKIDTDVDKAAHAVLIAARELADADLREQLAAMLARAQVAEAEKARFQRITEQQAKITRDLCHERDELRVKLNRRY